MSSGKALACAAAALALAGCGAMGKVEQGRVVAYDRQTKRITLIPESAAGFQPPITIESPKDPAEMGPTPAAGGLLRVDSKNRRIVVYNRVTQSIQTIQYSAADRTQKTITVYSSADRAKITFAATGDLLALPADTWRSGDVVRYYYKDPAQALRLMNVSKTDLSKSG